MNTTTEDAVESGAKTWTVLSLLEWASGYLAVRGFDEARLHTELLLAHVLAVPRLTLYVQFDRPLTREELDRFKRLFLRRVAREPLQYIIGETEFMGFRFAVDRRVLIPRPETENLVECVLEEVRMCARPPAEILDVGTGSGNVAVALALLVPASRVTSIDISAGALDVARANAERNGATNINFVHGDVLQELPGSGRFDLIVANPPYVSLGEYAVLEPEVREFEPRVAVTDEGDGSRFIRGITHLAAARLSSGGALFMEIAYNQAETAYACASTAGLRRVAVLKDFARRERILTALAPDDPP